MRIDGKPRRTIWVAEDRRTVRIFDQARLPHEREVVDLQSLEAAARAIETMQVRGAPLIGATAAYGVCLALLEDASDEGVERACARLVRTRPTAVNLRWALERMRKHLLNQPRERRLELAYEEAAAVCDEDVAICRAIGEHGLKLIREVAAKKRPGELVNVLTHCNAGWLATIDWGTATAPIYLAQEQGVPVHVWVDETRPRSQGAALTAFELLHQEVPHTVVADNVGGHLMQHGMVDLCIVGTDRTTRTGDVANKIGTYLKALAAKDNRVPFYVALPSTTVDWSMRDGVAEIPIEQRDPEEVTRVRGRAASGRVETVQVTPDGSPAANWGFDVTPARLVTGLITERGVCPASEDGLAGLFPERAAEERR
ncbi:MAG TPA: S-methyl-5-thioribose-1-phosphate isomerase [Geminicoccaceae bacterium]|nr:S-methyl-5-thioribose-1-phosphate isomerase [Geminicoccaceae bacterium]